MSSIPIIIVDDDELDRYIMSRVIEESGLNCKVHEFEAGDYFLDTFTSNEQYTHLIGENSPPAGILLDINMPRMDGFEVLSKIAELKEQGNFVPKSFFLLMVTSSCNPADTQKANQYGFVKDYIVKPLSADSFNAAINKYSHS